MAEEKTKTPEKKKRPEVEEQGEILVRIFGQDINGGKKIYPGLTRIKGVSWSISNALCLNLGLNRDTKISDLSKDTIKKIEDGLRNLKIPVFMMNRRSDIDTGDNLHLLTTDLDVKREFDMKRLKKIRSYKGIRHTMGLPVRGQRTRSHFRQKGKAVGVKKNDKKA